MTIVIGKSIDIGAILNRLGEIDVFPFLFALFCSGPIPAEVPLPDHLRMITRFLEQMPHGGSLSRNQMITGYQGEKNQISDSEKLAVSIKHFLGYQTTISGKDRTPSYIPEHVLR